jgi:hypothetical protein
MNLGSLQSVLGRVGNSMLQMHGGGGMGGMMGGGNIMDILSQHPEILQRIMSRGQGQYPNYLGAQPMGMYGQGLDLDAGATPMGFYGQNLNLGA